jgi:hypothetical protein
MRQGQTAIGSPQARDAWAPFLENPVKIIAHFTSRDDFVLQSPLPQQLLGEKTKGRD